MKILPIKLFERNVDPSFAQQPQLTVKVNGEAAFEQSNVSGMVKVQIDPDTPGTHVSLGIKIVSSDRNHVLEEWEQLFLIAPDLSLKPDPEAPSLPIWARSLHPRLSWASAATEPNTFPLLTADFTFLEVTKTVSMPKYHNVYNPPWLLDPKNPHRDNPHQGCTFHIVELTHALVPKSWMIIVPPPLDTSLFNDLRPRGHWLQRGEASARNSFDVLVFYRPSIPKGEYTKTADARVTERRLERYIIDPPADAPFFVRSPDEKPRWVAWDANSNNGFEQQLVRSGKKVIIAYPWPSGGNYGEAVTSRLPNLLQRLLICLYVNGAIGSASPASVQLDRMALAGFSYGANRAVDSWYANKNRTDEMYLMDPAENRSEPSFSRFLRDLRTIKSWLQQDARHGKNKKKKLRMIGGLSQRQMLALATQLDPQWLSLIQKSTLPNVWTRPTHTDFWKGNGQDEIYSRAQLPPALLTDLNDAKDPLSFKAPPERFDSIVDRMAPKSLLSRDTWLFLRDEPSETAVRLEAWEPGVNRGRIAELSFPVSHSEIAGFVRSFWWMDKNSGHVGEPIKTQDLASALARFVQSHIITDIGHNLRHQWTLVGGEKDPSRGTKFEGHLYLCLRDSNFD